MNLLKMLTGTDVVDGVQAVGNVVDKLFTSDDERLTKEVILTRLAQKPHIAQSETNKIEAKHRSVMVSGWRPFIGWICGCGLGFVFLVNPIIQWYSGIPGPQMPTESIENLIYGLLGLGTLRTVEKFGGRTK